MNTAPFYGIELALVDTVLLLVGFFLGYQTDNLASGQWFASLYLIAAIVVLWMGIRTARDETPDKTLTYSRGVRIGFLISLYSGTIYAVYTFIHYRFINRAHVEYYLDFARRQWIARGTAPAKMAIAEKIVRRMLSPLMMSFLHLFQSLLFGVIIALVLTALLRRAPATPAKAPPRLG